MSFIKKANLDRKILYESFEKAGKCVLGNDVSVKVHPIKDGQIHQLVEFIVQEKVCSLNVYLNTNGTTSLTPTKQNQEETHIIADLLFDYSVIDERKTFSFCVPDITDDQFTYLNEYLIENGKSTVSRKNDTLSDIYSYCGVNNDALTIKRFKNGNTQFQGKPIELYKEACYYLTNICDSSTIINSQQEFYRIEIKTDIFETLYSSLFVSSGDYLNKKIKDIILPSFSVYSLKIDNLTDYTMFVFPILRGMEGFIKQLFKEQGVVLKTSETLGSYFEDYTDNGFYNIEKTTRSVIDPKYVKSIENAFNDFRKLRNRLFHVDGMLDPTKVISTQEEAMKFIEETAMDIEKAYSFLK